MRDWSIVASVLAGALLGACGGSAGRVMDASTARDAGDADSQADAGDAETAAVELGSGETDFEPVTPNEHLMLHAGTQGGHHVWLSYRTQGLTPMDVRMELDVVPDAPARPAHSEVMIDLDAVSSDLGDMGGTEEAWSYEFIGWPAQILDPECAAGGSVTLTLKLTDKLGHSASGSMTVIADPPETGFTRTCTR